MSQPHNLTGHAAPTWLAADFGGGSGRVIAGTLRAGAGRPSLELREVHRFANRQVRLGDYLHWDFPALYADMLEGLRRAAAMGLDVRSIGVDTWGVDFGLVDSLGMLCGNPVCYRDTHTAGLPEEFLTQADPQAHYEQSGLQPMAINTMYRLMAMRRAADPKLDAAAHLLFMPDLFSYYLTGVAVNEYTIASTSELLNASTRQWNWELIDTLGLPRRLFGPIVMPGADRGSLTPRVSELTGLPQSVRVVAVGSHDTASAVHAAPGTYATTRSAFLSSGTWSLFGVELPEPLLTEQARLQLFSNEGGVGSIHFLQNITGLWIIQRLAEQWRQQGRPVDYSDLTRRAAEAADTCIIDVDHPDFQNPDGMEQTITRWCVERGLTPPHTDAEFMRCVCRSLADRYARAVSSLNAMLPEPIEQLHIIGGGSNNTLLNELTARATGLKVTAGPAEATAIGNILVQAKADGAIASAADLDSVTFV